ncbi:single-stranded DNA-binding protein [Eubacterium pyruvativorans]|uniref:single-stranded DNA-binding protein n=1 Tax=Eubacterium pyruvativorans TaxID=155865 RepID=UPI0015679489|nr:single-stranded DNA-binding protein [Eubacterium pyruvativorans]
MNSVMLIGRLTRDPEVRKADFPRVVVFGRQAETCEKYLAKGRLVAVEGRIQTGSYQNRNGDTVYTTDVVASRVEFLEWGDRPSGGQSRGGYQQNNGYQDRGGYRNEGGNSFAAPQQPSQPMRQQSPAEDDIPDTFEAIEDDVPF